MTIYPISYLIICLFIVFMSPYQLHGFSYPFHICCVIIVLKSLHIEILYIHHGHRAYFAFVLFILSSLPFFCLIFSAECKCWWHFLFVHYSSLFEWLLFVEILSQASHLLDKIYFMIFFHFTLIKIMCNYLYHYYSNYGTYRVLQFCRNNIRVKSLLSVIFSREFVSSAKWFTFTYHSSSVNLKVA